MTKEMPESRRTRQRTELWKALGLERERFRTAQEIHSLLQESGSSAGLTTTYRNLNRFTAEGIVHVATRNDGEKLFRRCRSPQHHHHLICRACGKTVELLDRSLEDRIKNISRRSQFSGRDHELDIFSMCLECKGDRASRTAEGKRA
jgi:Fur family transcriptional regulator, ferric uptake regulator